MKEEELFDWITRLSAKRFIVFWLIYNLYCLAGERILEVLEEQKEIRGERIWQIHSEVCGGNLENTLKAILDLTPEDRI